MTTTFLFIVFLLGTFLMCVTLKGVLDVFVWEKTPDLFVWGLIFILLALNFAGFIGLLIGFLVIKP